jgi:hypothetical protein
MKQVPIPSRWFQVCFAWLALLMLPASGFSNTSTSYSAFKDFWWNKTENADLWTNKGLALAQGDRGTSTTPNEWSYGLVNCTGGQPNDPYPTKIDAEQPGNFENGLNRDTWNQFWDIAQDGQLFVDAGDPVVFLYRKEGVDIGFFDRGWYELAPGYDGKGAGRNLLTNADHSNSRYLYLKPNFDAPNDGVAAAVRFTAPSAGTYRLQGEFLPGGKAPGKISVAIVKCGPKDNVVMPRTLLENDGNWLTFDKTVALDAGQAVTWLVGSGGDGGPADMVALEAEVTLMDKNKDSKKKEPKS